MAAEDGAEMDEYSDEYGRYLLDAFKKSVESISTNKKFTLGTPNACSTQETASSLLEWMGSSENEETIKRFCLNLGLKLRNCLERRGKTKLIKKDRVWSQYHQLRTSNEFIKEWTEFFHSAETAFNSFLCQHVTDVLFNETVDFEVSRKRSKTTNDDNAEATCTTKLSFLEQNALRYVCGYICRKVRDRFQTISDPLKEELTHAIMVLAGDEIYEEGTEDWLNKIDRGGLWHVNDEAYDLFVEMEYEAKKVLKVTCSVSNEDMKKNLKDAIFNNDDIKFKWCLLSAEMDQKAADILFEEMVSLFVTVRGFAFASGCVEFYKQAQKQNLQKKKALRKGIN